MNIQTTTQNQKNNARTKRKLTEIQKHSKTEVFTAKQIDSTKEFKSKLDHIKVRITDLEERTFEIIQSKEQKGKEILWDFYRTQSKQIISALWKF